MRKFDLMETMRKEIEKNLQDLSPELLVQINDYIEFLKERYLISQSEIPEWQKKEVLRRKYEMQNHPENNVSEEEMNYFLDKLEDES